MLTTLRRRLHSVRSDLVTAKYRLLGEEVRTMSVAGTEAEFKVGSHAERWRVEQCMGEREVVERFLNDVDDLYEVWDIGAAVGTYGILAAKRAEHVTAFEPETKNYQRLRENVELNSLENVDIRKVALSDTERTLRLEKADGDIGGGAHRIDEHGEVEISAHRGDKISAPNPDLIKIDVEGHELSVLKGLGQRLDKCNILYVEVHPEQDVEVTTVRSNLESKGFVVTELPTKTRTETYLRASKE